MAVEKYSLKHDGNKNITEHFKVKEFASIDSKGKIYTDTILIDSTLIDALEVMRALPGVSKIRIVNGYRSPEHNKAAGGSNSSFHTSGNAVDIAVYDEKGKIISAKIICCIAQDLGLFNGIANISAKYQNVHLDNGNRVYKGDEIKGYKTVTTDFYKYFGVTKAAVAKYTGKTVVKTPITTWQTAARKDGFKLDADGFWGKESEAVAKKAVCKKGCTYSNLTKIIQSAVGVKADGKFGNDTRTAVKDWQKENGLTPDGMFGLKSWKTLLGV